MSPRNSKHFLGRLAIPIIALAPTTSILFGTPVALAAIPSADQILSRAAARRASIAFKTLVAEGYRQDTPSGPSHPVWEAIWVGKGHRVEEKTSGGSQVSLTVKGRRWRYQLGEKAPAPNAIGTDLFTSFLGRPEKDPGGRRSVAFLTQRGIDHRVVSLSRLGKRIAYVIGAGPRDLTKPQLWFDKELLLPIRLIEMDKVSKETTDTHLIGYGSPTTKEWYPKRVDVIKGGKLIKRVHYQSTKLNTALSADLFRPPS